MFVLRIFWGKKHERNSVSDMSTFFAESKHMMVPHVSATFQPIMLKTKNKFKVFAASRFNQSTIPSQIVLCEFLLINLLHQRLIVINEYPPPPRVSPSG